MISSILGFLSGIALILAAIITTYDVFARTLFGVHTIWALEIAQYALLFASFMGAAYAMKENSYICVDFFVKNLSFAKQRVINSINAVFVSLLFFFLAYLAFSQARQYFAKGWRTSTPMRVQLYILILIIAIGSLVLALQQLAVLFNQEKEAVSLDADTER